MASRDIGRIVFDEVAALYDEARPRYPRELIDDIVSLSGIPPGGRILEVGCGTGQATLSFAERGYSMLCLEPGPKLASLAAENLREYLGARIEVVTFEDWEVEEKAYDLVVFADSFRWIPRAIGYSKSARALKDSGALAIFRNASPYEESEFRRELDFMYQKHAPQLAEGTARRPSQGSVDEREQEINRTGLFGKVIVRYYPWSVEYDAGTYIKLLNTYSDHRLLPEEVRSALFAAITDLIERHGRTFTKRYVAALHLAKKRPNL